MFVLSVKTSRRQLLSFLAFVGLTALLIITAIALPPQTDRTVSSAFPVSLRVTDIEEQIAFLQALGYRADPASMQVEEVLIPEEADEALKSYEALQKETNLSLEAYGGKRVRFYTYSLENAVEGTDAQAHLYVYRDRVIAGDIASTEKDGFLYPLRQLP